MRVSSATLIAVLLLAAPRAHADDPIKLTRLGLHEGAVLAAAVDAKGQTAITGGMDRRLIVWDLKTLRQKTRCCEHPEEVTAITTTDDPDLVFTACGDRQLRECKLSTGNFTRGLGGHDKRVFALAAPRNDDFLYAVDADGQLRAWKKQGGQSPLILLKDRRPLHALCPDASGKWLFVAGEDRRITKTARTEGGQKSDLIGSQDAVHALVLTADGDQLLSAGSDKIVRLWDVRSGTEVRRWEGYGDRIYALAVIGDRVLVGGPNGSLAAWDYKRNLAVGRTKMLAGVLSAASAPSSNSAVIGLNDGSVWTAALSGATSDAAQ